MKSIHNMITQLKGLLDTKDLNEWETIFVKSVAEQSEGKDTTRNLTSKQLEIIERIFNKNFGG